MEATKKVPVAMRLRETPVPIPDVYKRQPPAYVIFILATTEPHKIPVTVLSRCQRYDFKRMTSDVLVDRLKELVTYENVEIEEKALRYIAKKADGGMRDAISLLDQCIAFHLSLIHIFTIFITLQSFWKLKFHTIISQDYREQFLKNLNTEFLITNSRKLL